MTDLRNYTPIRFKIDDTPITYNGYVKNGDAGWNGWLNPYVTAETFNQILADFATDPESGDTIEQLREDNKSPNSDGLYCVGYGLAWIAAE